MNPFFSIVIPTRNRCETLHYSIKTVLEQGFKDFELIISDNNSSDDTEQVVADFNDARVKYYRSPTDLAMIDNWELGVGKIRGQYVIFFGDDDGLVGNALFFLHDLIKNSDKFERFDVFSWLRAGYYWPDLVPEELSDRLSVPLKEKLSAEVCDSEVLIDQVISGEKYYTELPMLYNAAVKKGVLDRIRSKNREAVFVSSSPDVFSGFAIAHIAKEFVRLPLSISINGASSKSNGIAFMFAERNNCINKEFEVLNSSASGGRAVRQIPFVRSIYAPVFDSFVHFTRIFEQSHRIPSVEQAIELTISNLSVYSISEQIESYDLLRYYALKCSKATESWFLEKYSKEDMKISSPALDRNKSYNFQRGFLFLDASDFNIQNIHEASKFVASLVGLDHISPSEIGLEKHKELKKNILGYNFDYRRTLLKKNGEKMIKKIKAFLESVGLRKKKKKKRSGYSREQLIAEAENYPSVVNNGYRHLEKTVDLVGFFKLKPEDAIVDVGGAKGEFALWFSEKFPTANVYSFEPIKETYAGLVERVGGHPNIHTRNCGLGSSSADVEINKLDRITSSSLLPVKADISNDFFAENLKFSEKQTVRISTLDEEIPSGLTVNILKIDVQGYEVEVLKGGVDTLKRVNIIVVEMQNHFLYEGAPLYYDLDACLRKANFSLYDIVPSIRKDKKLYEWDGIYINNALLKE